MRPPEPGGLLLGRFLIHPPIREPPINAGQRQIRRREGKLPVTCTPILKEQRFPMAEHTFEVTDANLPSAEAYVDYLKRFFFARS